MNADSERLDANVRDALAHLAMWGSAAYTVRKMGSRWHCAPFFGMNVSPLVYRTKGKAVAAFERFHEALLLRAREVAQ